MLSSTSVVRDDDHYDDFLNALRGRFRALAEPARPLFTTAAVGLWETFREALPAEARQHYTCRSCQRFVESFGGVVAIDPGGAPCSVLWDPSVVPDFFREAVRALNEAVMKAPINGVFLSDQAKWGLPSNTAAATPETPARTWYHMAIAPAATLIFKPGVLKTVDQVMAEKRQDYEILQRGLAEFSIDVVRQAHTLLSTDGLFHSEVAIGIATWLLNLHEQLKSAHPGRERSNLVWLAVAVAPTGFCHVRSTMISTLIDDIVKGLPFADIKAKWNAKMDPLLYQRPQAAPAAGNLAEAEKIVEKLGAASALKRRFARLEEVVPHALWTPKPPEAPPAAGGVFGHIRAKGASAPPAEISAPPTVMTWKKFERLVLPTAEAIDLYVAHKSDFYSPIITACDPEALPILQWDRAEKRNPFSWYVRHNGCLPSVFNLTAGTYVPVTAVVLQPSMWDGEELHAQHKKAVFFLLQGARERETIKGGAFFPGTLKSDFHAIRSSMEAFATEAVIEGREEGSASGLRLQSESPWDCLFRVTTKGGARVMYKLDRWD